MMIIILKIEIRLVEGQKNGSFLRLDMSMKLILIDEYHVNVYYHPVNH
jgi:hypothetical protein